MPSRTPGSRPGWSGDTLRAPMAPLAQYYDSGAGSAFAGIFFVMLLILAAVSFIPASIASSKGYSAVAFYFFGLFFFLPR